MTDLPAARPARPFFSSGPCAKPPGWSADRLATESLGRSHRSKIGKARLKRAIDLTRKILKVPDTHLIGIVPGSDTGAVEMAMWSLLGARKTTLLARSEEHTSELQSLMRISYAVFCLKKKKKTTQ